MGLCAGTDSQASPFQMRTMVHVQAYRDIRKMHEQIRGMTKMARTIYIYMCIYIYIYLYCQMGCDLRENWRVSKVSHMQVE